MDLGLAERHTITHEVQVNLHMLRSLVLNRVGGHIHGTHILSQIHNGSSRWWMMEFLQELAKPTRLGYVVCNNAIFSLRTRAGDRRLSLGRLGDQIVTNDAFDELKMGCARVMHE
jgi:hypothetical protein